MPPDLGFCVLAVRRNPSSSAARVSKMLARSGPHYPGSVGARGCVELGDACCAVRASVRRVVLFHQPGRAAAEAVRSRGAASVLIRATDARFSNSILTVRWRPHVAHPLAPQCGFLSVDIRAFPRRRRHPRDRGVTQLWAPRSRVNSFDDPLCPWTTVGLRSRRRATDPTAILDPSSNGHEQGRAIDRKITISNTLIGKARTDAAKAPKATTPTPILPKRNDLSPSRSA